MKQLRMKLCFVIETIDLKKIRARNSLPCFCLSDFLFQMVLFLMDSLTFSATK
jgi:hypothetical protein